MSMCYSIELLLWWYETGNLLKYNYTTVMYVYLQLTSIASYHLAVLK